MNELEEVEGTSKKINKQQGLQSSNSKQQVEQQTYQVSSIRLESQAFGLNLKLSSLNNGPNLKLPSRWSAVNYSLLSKVSRLQA